MIGSYEVTDQQLDCCWLDGNYTKKDVPPKHHTIRAGNRWKVGDWFSPRVWSGKPYASKQIEFAPPIQIKKVYPILINTRFITPVLFINDAQKHFTLFNSLAKNDGLEYNDFVSWFRLHPKAKSEPFTGQILCWNESIEY